MNDAIELIHDGSGLAVIGEEKAVEKFLRSAGQWTASRDLELARLRPLLRLGSDIVEAASEIATSSGRWIKLTEESAKLVGEHGLMKSKVPGESHLMVGNPGSVKSWLQAEAGPGTLLSNPAVLSGVAGLMAQAASQQTMAEITAYLAKIDEKVDDLLVKVDATVLKDMDGARLQIRRALTMREEEGRVTVDSWSEVQNASGKLADVQGYALRQLEAVAEKLETQNRIGGLAQTAEAAKPEVQKWLAVLAECFQLQEAFDVLALDRALDESPDALNARRRGLEADRKDRIDNVFRSSQDLLARMDAAVDRANRQLVWTRAKSLSVVESGNDLAARIHACLEALGIQADLRTWDARQLGPALEVGAQTIQGAKDAAPYAGTVLGVVGVAFVGKKVHGPGS